MTRRIWTVFGIFILFYIAIILRLFYWQVLASPALKSEAASQHFFRFTLPASRGSIISSDGYPIVMNEEAYLVFAEPPKIKDMNEFLMNVSKTLAIDQASLSAQIASSGKLWAPLAHKVGIENVQKLQSLKIDGLGFEPEPKRFYPEASMAAHLLGFVASDQNGMDKGYFGLEGYYDRELRGKDGSLRIEKDVKGNPILIGQTYRVDPEDGRNLILWMDRTIQGIVERRLREGIEKYGAKEGTVVVMDPKTGGILAMASYPSYDLRSYTQYGKELYINPAVANSYEPGSTFKSVVMATGIDAGVITPETTMDENGPVEVGGYQIRTWNSQYNGNVSMIDVLKHSSNVGMVFVGQKLGRDRMLAMVKNFGFGNMTGVDLEDESSPDIRPDKQWYDIDLATLAFGQGIAVTPLQMVRSVGALANGGYLMEPHMVKTLQDAQGREYPIPPKKIRQVLSKKATEEITEMMVTAVDEGEAKWAKPKGYRIAGKTGTAQIPVAGHYDDKKTIASFVGFAPADEPRFVMLVSLRETSSSQWGSETAAPLFFNIAKDLFLYWGIPAK